MKNSNNDGFDQHDKAQAAVEQDSFLIVASTLSNHPNDQAEAIPTLDAIPLALGKPKAGALDHGYFSATNIAAMEARDIERTCATGRTSHHPSWQSYFAQQPAPPPADASPKVQMAYKLQTEIGGAIYRLRKCTVEPVLGIIKDTLGLSPILAAWLAGRRWRMVSGVYGLQLEASASLDHGLSGPTAALGGRGQRVCSCAQVPNGQKRFTHQDALGYAHVVFLGKWSTTDSP